MSLPFCRRVFPRVPAQDELFSPTEPTGAPQRLAHIMQALLHIMSIVLNKRIAKGDALREHASRANMLTCLADIAPLFPIPRLHHVEESDFVAAAYQGALESRVSLFDTKYDVDNPTVEEYLDRLVTYGEVSQSIFLTMLIYVDRVAAMCPAMILTSTNVHRLLAACFVLAAKTHEDRHPRMSALAQVVGLNLKEVITLESTLLEMINWRAHVSVHEFAAAEAVFMAEAFDTVGGMVVFRDLLFMNVDGMDSALGECETWDPVDRKPTAEEIWVIHRRSLGLDIYPVSPRSLAAARAAFVHSAARDSSNWFIPYPEAREHCAWRIKDIAKAQLAFDFKAIDVNPAPGLELEAEQQVQCLFGESGLARFQKLRLLAVDSAPDAMVPALCKRQASTDPWRDGYMGSGAALGPFMTGYEHAFSGTSWSEFLGEDVDSEDEGLIPRRKMNGAQNAGLFSALGTTVPALAPCTPMIPPGFESVWGPPKTSMSECSTITPDTGRDLFATTRQDRGGHSAKRERASVGLGILGRKHNLWPGNGRRPPLAVTKRRTAQPRISRREVRSIGSGDRQVFVNVMSRIFRH